MITVLGASGVIGSYLVRVLQERGIAYSAPARDADLAEQDLGTIIYSIGLTADFRSRPFDTVDAHVCKLNSILQTCKYDSLIYLSSTRLYQSGEGSEDQPIAANPTNFSDLYNISKLMGESIALAANPKNRVARISNVYGNDLNAPNFLSSILRDAIYKGRIVLETSGASAKDYISIQDVAEGLLRIAQGSDHQIYNLASGKNVTNQQLVDRIAAVTGCAVEVPPGAPTVNFPPIWIERLQAEFHFTPRGLMDNIDELVRHYAFNKENIQ